MSSSSSRRDRVLAALRTTTDPLTVPQLAEDCECSEVSVRRALRDLVDVGLVEHVGNLPRYDQRDRLTWGRGHGQYQATVVPLRTVC